MKLVRLIIVALGLFAFGANAATWHSNVKIKTAYIVYNLNGSTNSLVLQIPNPNNPTGVLEFIYTIDPNSTTSIQRANSLLAAALTAITTGLPANLLVEGSSILLGIGFDAQ